MIAALAGDPEARAVLDVPLPAFVREDRNPATERGVGDLDPAQQHALDAVAAGASLVIDSPPGALTAETIAAVVADAAASGRTVLHVPGTRRAAESLQAVMEGMGLRRLMLDASRGSSGDAHRVGDEITTALARELPAGEREGVHALRDEHRRLHGELRAQVEAWHRVNPTWNISPHRVIQELAALTSSRPAPANEVRLGADVLRRLRGDLREQARGELARAASLGAFVMRRPDSPGSVRGCATVPTPARSPSVCSGSRSARCRRCSSGCRSRRRRPGCARRAPWPSGWSSCGCCRGSVTHSMCSGR